MSYVDEQVAQLTAQGIYSANMVDADVINKIVNMEEWDYYNIDIQTLESYLGLLAQQALYIQQLCNIAEAKEIELSNEFKMLALPYTVGAKIRSVEERWLYASTITPELEMKFKAWQEAVIQSVLKKDLAKPIIEKLNVLKKIYDDRRLEGASRNLHKYTDGGS
jgi:hypothetical protein